MAERQGLARELRAVGVASASPRVVDLYHETREAPLVCPSFGRTPKPRPAAAGEEIGLSARAKDGKNKEARQGRQDDCPAPLAAWTFMPALAVGIRAWFALSPQKFFRFWQPFQEWKHGHKQPVEDLRQRVLTTLRTAGQFHARVPGPWNSRAVPGVYCYGRC